MLNKNKKLSPEHKRKILLVLRIILISAAVLYLLFTVYQDYSTKDEYDLYFSTADANYIKAEKRVIEAKQDVYEELFVELKAGPKTKDLRKTIPEGSQLIAYNIENKLLTLNFNAALRDNHWGGSTGEMMTIYSIVNTYTKLQQIDKVKILIENEEVETLVGHLDLTQPLSYNQELIELE